MSGGWEEQWRLQDLLYCLDQVAADISPRRMEAFRLYVLQGMSAAFTAKQLEMPVAHVYVTRNQVLRMIRERMLRLETSRDPEADAKGDNGVAEDDER